MSMERAPGRVLASGDAHIHLRDGSVRRSLRRRERFALYGVLGWAMEVGFTGVDSLLRGRADRRLAGHSYLWMLPIYGLVACLYEPARDALRTQPAWLRGGAYAAGIVAVEYLTGQALRRTVGECPWEYPPGWATVQGVTRLDYLPLWLALGLLLERVDDVLREAPLLPATAH